MRRRAIFLLGLVAAGLFAPRARALPARLPTAVEVQELRAKYQAEHTQVVQDGTAKHFLPVLLERAEEIARKADAALHEGRLAQAREAYRLARWQLPYQSGQVPDHVTRILGSLRLRHGRGLHAVAFSPDGQRLATCGGDALVKVWDLANGRELLSYAGHGDAAYVRFVAWTPDGKQLASAGADKEVRLWDAATGKDVRTFEVTGQSVSALAIAPDGKYLLVGAVNNAAGQQQGSLVVFDLNSGKQLRAEQDFRGHVRALAFNPAGSLLAVGDERGQVRLWQFPQVATNPTLPAYWTKQEEDSAAYALAFSPDGQTLARAGQGDVKIYTVPTPGAAFQVAQARRIVNMTGTPHCVVYSKDGKTLFTGDNEGMILAWDPESGQRTGAYKGHVGTVWSLALHPEGNQLASASSGDNVARLWDFDVVLQARDLAGHAGAVWMAAFSPDGHRVVSAGADRTVKVWDTASGKMLLELAGHTAPVTAALYSPDGKQIATAGGDKLVRLFDAESGKLLHQCAGHQATVTCLDFSPDGTLLASGGADRSVRVWDVAQGRQAYAIEDHPSVAAAVAFRPDGKQLAVGSIDHTIGLYDARTGKAQQRWPAHLEAVTCLGYSPDGQYLASGGADGALEVWLTATPGTAAAQLPTAHGGPVSMVGFRKDSQHLVSGGGDQLVKLWKLEANALKELQTFRGHKDWVTAAAFSRDGYHVVSASVDRLVKVWEVTSRDLPLQPEHTSAVEAIAFSPDGKLVATGASDNTIKLWDWNSGAELATLVGHPQSVVSLVFTPDGKMLVSSGYEGALRLWDVAPPRERERTAAQKLAFDHLERHSPYIFLEPTGKKLFVWLPVSQGPISTRVRCFELADGKPLFEFTDSNRKVNSLAFCANGKLAATGAKDGSVRLHDLTKEGVQVPGGDWFLFDKVGVADLALTPDGKTLLATGDDGTVQVADVASREVRKRFQAHPGRIMACVSSPDGKRCATVGLDNVLKLWDLQAGRELRRWVLGRPASEAQGLLLSNLAFAPDGRHLVTANANTTVYVLELP